MASINITPANHSPVISCLGTDDTFVELSFRRLGGLIELIATKVQYNAYTGLYLRDELGREVVANEDAGSVACDLEWKAVDALDETDERGVADPCGFEEAVERELAAATKADRDSYMAAAIAHNAALVAAE